MATTPTTEKPTDEAKPKDISVMSAAELFAHIKATDEAHRAWMTNHRALLRCRPGGVELLEKKPK